jgi:hypothetical protein
MAIHRPAEGGPSGDRTMESALQHGTAAFLAGLQPTSAASHLAEANGGMEMWKNAARFPHLHTPEDDYELLSKKALH